MAAALGMLAGCYKPEMVQISAPEDVVAPVLEAVEGPIEITAANMANGEVAFAWTPAEYGVNTQVDYSLEVAAAAAPETKVTITSGITEPAVDTTHITTKVTYETLNAILYNDLGLADGVAEDVLFFVGAKVGEYAKIYSEGVKVSAQITAAEKTYPMIYMPGSYQEWKPDQAAVKFQVLYDFAGNGVFEGIADFGKSNDADRAWKFTCEPNWDFDWGIPSGETPAAEAAEITLINNDGGDRSNIDVYTVNRYYHFSMDTNTGLLKKNYSFDQIGVIGSFNGWGGDVVMEFNAAKRRFYADVEFAEDGQFKLRADADWAVNWGADAFGMTVSNGDGNLEAKAGNYRVYAYMSNPAEMTIELVAGMFGKDEPAAGVTPPAEEPEKPEAPVMTGWGLVGTINNWGNLIEDENKYIADTPLLNDGTWYVAKSVEFAEAGEVKIRLDGKWDKSFGLAADVTFAADTELAVTSDNGANIAVPAGTYDIYFNPETAKAWFITDGTYPGGAAAPEASEWGIVGQVNGWAAPDITMYKTATEGLFVAYKVEMPDGGFKIRANGEWNDAANYGLETKGDVEVDHVYDVITGGGSGDMVLVAGTYDIWFDLTNAKVYIMTPGKAITEAEGGEAPAPEDPADKTWYMVGNFNGWNPGDDAYKMTAEGDYFVFKNFTAAEGCEAKFAPGEWNGDKGGDGTFAVNAACATGSSNIAVTAGTYDVYLAKDLSVYYFMEAGKTPSAE